MSEALSIFEDISVVTNVNENTCPHLLVIHSPNANRYRGKLKDSKIPFLHHYQYGLSETSLSKKASKVFRKDYSIWKDFISLPFHLHLTSEDISEIQKALK